MIYLLCVFSALLMSLVISLTVVIIKLRDELVFKNEELKKVSIQRDHFKRDINTLIDDDKSIESKSIVKSFHEMLNMTENALFQGESSMSSDEFKGII